MEKRQKEQSFIFEGEQLTALHECHPCCALFSDEEKAWGELKQYLEQQPFVVWCTFIGWDNFLNRTILTGKVPNFMKYLKGFVQRFPADMYHLTDGGILNTAKVVNE